MEQKQLTDYTDQELLEESKKERFSPIASAVFIGFLAGIIVFSVVKNTWGLLTLIPLFLIYKAVNQSKNKELEKLLKQRNLK